MLNSKLVESILYAYDEELDELEIVERGEWVNEYKNTDSRETIVKYKDKYYKLSESRSGDYYNDYEYDDTDVTEVTEVTPITVQTIAWKPV